MQKFQCKVFTTWHRQGAFICPPGKMFSYGESHLVSENHHGNAQGWPNFEILDFFDKNRTKVIEKTLSYNILKNRRKDEKRKIL